MGRCFRKRIAALSMMNSGCAVYVCYEDELFPSSGRHEAMMHVLFLADMGKNMKHENILKTYFTQEQIDAAIAAAPEYVDDPDCPYDPNDEAAVHAYWSKATLTFPGGHPHQVGWKRKNTPSK